MIILLDTEKQQLVLYKDDGIVNIPFVKASSIYDYLDGINVLYITNAIEVDAADIIDTIKGMGIAIEEDNFQETGTQYLRGTSKGTIYIDETLKFDGPFDCKAIDQKMTQIIQANPILNSLIKNKKIEIIGERKKNKLMKDCKKSQMQQIEKQSLADKRLDNIIMKTKVENWDGSIGASDHEDAIVVDVEGTGKIGEDSSFNTMSELLGEIEGIE